MNVFALTCEAEPKKLAALYLFYSNSLACPDFCCIIIGLAKFEFEFY